MILLGIIGLWQILLLLFVLAVLTLISMLKRAIYRAVTPYNRKYQNNRMIEIMIKDTTKNISFNL